MLDDYEDLIQDQYDTIDDRDKAFFYYKFNRKDGDVRCCAYIYNIIVQAGQSDFHYYIPY
jgi:hypothetical protein